MLPGVWSPLFGGRQSAALPDWSFCGAQRLGKTAALVPSRWSFERRHMLDTLADWWGLQRHCGGRGHTSRTLPRAGSVSASRNGLDRSCAHGRVNSGRAVDRPCSRLIRLQGPHPRTTAWRACLRRSHALGCCWWNSHTWTARGAAGRFRRLEDSGEDHPAGKCVPNSRSRKRAATPHSSRP